ncbi:MAG TPA: fatty acid desaturase, partial [Stenomitos sp.]
SIILMLWGLSLPVFCAIDFSKLSLVWWVLAILGRTFLQTGLFILAHDAMHGSLVPYCKSLNDRVGQFCVNLYAGLSYQQCCINHAQHHRYPGQIGDPDFHDGLHRHPLQWYIKFLQSYLTIPSITLLLLNSCLVFLILRVLFNLSIISFMIVWILPLVLSSIQLFVFGTYLPHRQETISIALKSKLFPELFSLLTCYHFGTYHWEHHQYPKTPWYQLPQVQRS